MPHRLRPIERAAEFLHDGDLLQAEAGEPLVHALLAADRLVLARSTKLHRPRGPYCLQAACDGCLVRVNGVANVMACQQRVLGGETVETQNVLGSRELDLLAATDFMFPHGLDAHRLFAGVRGVSPLLQRLARRIAGLGRLPDEIVDARAGRARDVDVVVIGAGASGLAIASALGAGTLVVDESVDGGGATRALNADAASSALSAAARAGVEILTESTACSVYREPESMKPRLAVLVATPRGVLWLRTRAVVLATGTHAALPDLPGNDLPGVFSARAGLQLVRGGVQPDERVVLLGSGRFSDACAELLKNALVARVSDPTRVARIVGVQRVRGLEFTEGNQRSLRAGAVLFDAPATPAFELAVQAGASLEFDPESGYTPRTDASGRAAERVWCAGSVLGRARDACSITATVAAIRATLQGD